MVHEQERAHGMNVITDICSNHPIFNPEWVGAEMARLPLDPKDAKTAFKPKKEKRMKSKKTNPKEVRPNILKKKSKLVGIPSGSRTRLQSQLISLFQ